VKKFLFFSLCLLWTNHIFSHDESGSAKVLIMTHSYNRPDFIEMQHKTFKKLLADDYEFVVFNDAQDQQIAKQIDAMCAHYNIRCIRIPQQIHARPYLPRVAGDPLNRPNIRHANCVQYSFDVLGFDHDGIVFVIDSDMFLIRPLSIVEHMRGKDIVAVIQGSSNNVWYLWPGMMLLDMHKLPDKRSLNFNCGVANGASVDSGGWSYYYLSKHSELTVVNLSSSTKWSYQLFLAHRDAGRVADNTISDDLKINTYTTLGFNEKEIKFLLKKPDTFEFYWDLHFLHYRGGTNHDKMSAEYNATKTNLFRELIDDALRDCV